MTEVPKCLIYLGDYECIDHLLGGITLALPNGVRITVHPRIQHSVKKGDKCPIFVEITLANPGPPKEISSGEITPDRG